MITTATPPLAPPPARDGIRYRLWRGMDELPGMAAANQRLRDACGQLEPVDEEAMRHRYTHLVNSDPLVDCVVAGIGDTTVGYTRVEWHDLTDGDRSYELTLVVDPAAVGLGVTAELLAWAEARARQVAAAHPTDRRRWLGTFVFDGADELAGSLTRHGYSVVRLGADMLRPDLDALPAIVVPDGYDLRTPAGEELRAVSDMAVEAFREHFGEAADDPETSFREWVEDPQFRRELVTVAWRDGVPAAMTSAVLQPHDGRTRGYVSAVATHPAHRRRGLGRATLVDSLHRLRAAGASDAYLGVDAQNQNRAFALYEDVGFRRVAGATTWRRPFDHEEHAP